MIRFGVEGGKTPPVSGKKHEFHALWCTTVLTFKTPLSCAKHATQVLISSADARKWTVVYIPGLERSCIGRRSYSGKPHSFLTTSFRELVTLYLTVRRKPSSGNCLWWSLNKMELFTIDISIWWNKRIFHHFLHFIRTLLVPSIWSERSTAFIFLLYFSIAPGCGIFLVLHWPWVFAFRLTFFLTFALSIVLIIETTLLSTHCNTRQGGSLSPIFFLAHSLLFFKIYRKISPGFQDGACGGKTMGNEAFEKGKRTIEVMNNQMITSTEKKGSFDLLHNYIIAEPIGAGFRPAALPM